jgi:hypothetical protein
MKFITHFMLRDRTKSHWKYLVNGYVQDTKSEGVVLSFEPKVGMMLTLGAHTYDITDVRIVMEEHGLVMATYAYLNQAFAPVHSDD